MQLTIPTETAVKTIRWGNRGTAGEEVSLLAAGCKEGLIYIFNVKQAALWAKLDTNDQQ